MNAQLKPATRFALAGVLCAAIVCAIGCKDKPAASTPTAATPKPVLMDATTRATAAKAAAQHPGFKVFLQKIDMPTILVVPEATTDDQLKNLLWFLRIKAREGKFKELGLHPTATVFGKPGYSSGVLNIYRGDRCAKEMYITSVPDPCGPSIHKSASYHWGEGGDPKADGADFTPQNGATVLLFAADDGWQTDEEASTDPNGSLHKASVARIQHATKLNAHATRMYQGSDMRFAVTDPDDQLRIVSYQLATDAGRQTFLTQFLILERDHLCSLAFKSLQLGTLGSTAKAYPINCTP